MTELESFSVRLESDADVSHFARAELSRRLNGHLRDRRGDLDLLVSELVTNGVQHGRPDAEGRIELRLEWRPEGLRVEVLDEGGGFDFDLERPRADADSCFGLFLVDRISDRWGTDVDDGRTRVWFELDAA